ncbi:nucleoside permease [Thorsellia kenyensis]|uniref:Nucleoside permease n=1 Tax=Thorsellia kenyensis TaxID=1549888 RepID=A0ABV6C7C0_9GAMM
MNIKLKLKVILFLQFFVWGSWLISLGGYMSATLNFNGLQIGAVYGSLGLSSLLMPSLLGIVADKWIPANRLYIFCQLFGAIMLALAATATTPGAMFLFILLHCLAFMPTIAMSNAISYFALEKEGYDVLSTFPKIRIWGTIGFIFAMWTISFLKLELSHKQLLISSGAAVLLSIVALILPKIPVEKAQINKGLASLLGLDAFKLLKQPKLAVFFIFTIFLGAILQININFSSAFIQDFKQYPEYSESFVVLYPSFLLSLSQIAEVFFILCVPFFMRKFGIKYVMLISMLAWGLRFGLFAIGDPSVIGSLLLVLSMVIYGCAFDFYNISGGLFIEKSVPSNIRNRAQGLFLTMSGGIGAYMGAISSGLVVDLFTNTDNIKDWQAIWLTFAAYSVLLALIFFFVFKESSSEESSLNKQAKTA